jgi:hypothetical protein
MIFFLSIYFIGFIASVYHLYCLKNEERTKKRVLEILLLYQIVFSLGITSLVSFFGLTFMAEYVAEITNWPSCPFEQQLANVNLGYGILGILCIFYRGNFWVATIVGFSIWIIGDGIHHFYHAVAFNNYSSGNVGVPLWTDFIVPLILILLLYLHNREVD